MYTTPYMHAPLIAEHPEHVNARGGEEVTPLHVAVSAGHSDILLLLIEYGADMNGRGKRSGTPLHRASWNGRLEAGQLLLNRGADIDDQDCTKGTALIYAAMFGHAKFARMLLKCGAMIDTVTRMSSVRLHFTVQHNSDKPKSCNYYWSVAQIPMCATKMAEPLLSQGHDMEITR
jgi:ankyrin repeat protein